MLDLDQARTFLSAITSADPSDTNISFQTFDDVEERKDDTLARVKLGTLDKVANFLVEMNKKKAGVFIAVNRVDGHRKTENVRELRAAFIDCDNVEVDFESLPLKPNIIVQSGRGAHAYWLLERGESLDRFRSVQKALAYKFGSDDKIVDLPRVMRLPGFLHQKKDPSLLVELVYCNTEKLFTIDELFDGLNLEAPPESLRVVKPTYRIQKRGESRRDVSLEDKINRCEKYLEGIGAAVSGSGGHATTVQACRAGHDFDLPEATFWPMLLRWNQSCVPPWREEELRYTYEHSASKYPAGNKLDVELHGSRWTPSAADVRVPDDTPWQDSNPGITARNFGRVGATFNATPPDRDGWSENENGRIRVVSDDASEGGLSSFIDVDVLKGRDRKRKTKAKSDEAKPKKKKKRKKKRKPGERLGLSASDILSDQPPIYGDMDRDPLQAAHILLKEYNITHEDSGQWYFYDASKWIPTSKHTVEKAVMQYTTPDEFCVTFSSETILRIKNKCHQKRIDWNQVEPTEIPVLDGVLNFMTGEVRPHEFGDYLERIVPYKYNPDAECPTWHRCLEDWLPGRDDEKRAIQLFLGYCLMPHARYKKALMLYGPPHTGKSQVCMVATELVGGTDYTCGILPSKMNDPRACAPIKGAALNVIPDLPKGQLIGDGGFKAMVSAGDTIQIDQKHIAPEQYTPTAKHIFATNNLPAINDPSSGVFERLLILTFDCPIAEEKRDPHLEDKIKKEIEGVLAWAVEGAKQLYELNGNWPKVQSSVDAIEKYKLDENPVHDFLEESGMVEAIPTGSISIEELTKLFNEYHSGKEWTKKAIRQRVEALGYIKVRVGSKRGIKGIRKTGSQLQLVAPDEDS